MNKNDADDIAINALYHIAASDTLLADFLSLTGMTPQTIRQSATDPGFLSASLDFLRQNESEAIAFATNHGLRAEDMERAAYLLSGQS